jgi:hypothetical protein
MLAGLVGNGLGILIIGLCWIVMRHVGGGGAPSPFARGGGGGGGKGWEKWVMRGIILLMLLGGAALTLTGIGDLLHDATTGLFGLFGATAELIIDTLLFAYLLFEVVMGVWRKPGKKQAWSAVFLAFALTLPLVGEPAHVADQIHTSTSAYADEVGSWLGV